MKKYYRLIHVEMIFKIYGNAEHHTIQFREIFNFTCYQFIMLNTFTFRIIFNSSINQWRCHGTYYPKKKQKNTHNTWYVIEMTWISYNLIQRFVFFCFVFMFFWLFIKFESFFLNSFISGTIKYSVQLLNWYLSVKFCVLDDKLRASLTSFEY